MNKRQKPLASRSLIIQFSREIPQYENKGRWWAVWEKVKGKRVGLLY